MPVFLFLQNLVTCGPRDPRPVPVPGQGECLFHPIPSTHSSQPSPSTHLSITMPPNLMKSFTRLRNLRIRPSLARDVLPRVPHYYKTDPFSTALISFFEEISWLGCALPFRWLLQRHIGYLDWVSPALLGPSVCCKWPTLHLSDLRPLRTHAPL